MTLLSSILESLEEALSAKARKKMPKRMFAVPSRRAWPINDREHAITAIAYMHAKRGDAKDYPAVIKKIRSRFKGDKEIMQKLSTLMGKPHMKGAKK